MAAVPIPSEGSLTVEQRDQILQTLEAYMVRWEVKHSDILKGTGLTEGTLSPILNRTYLHAKLDEHLRTLNDWMEVDARRRAGKRERRPLTDSHVVALVRTAVTLCRQTATMGYVVGPTGIGKTATLQEIVRKEPGTVLITVDRYTCGAQGLLRELCEALKVGSRKKGELAGESQKNRLRFALERSHRLLIFDDAHKLRPTALEALREIHDLYEIPLLLVGVIDLAETIRRYTDEDHGQLESRFGVQFDVNKTLCAEGGSKKSELFTREQIARILNEPGVRLLKDAVDYLYAVANDPTRGAMRQCLYLVFLAARGVRRRQQLSRTDPVRISAADLRACVRTCRRTRFEDEETDAASAEEAAPAPEARTA